VLSQAEKDAAGCSAFYLLNSYDGTPAAPNGTGLHDHLISLAGGTSPTGPTKTSTKPAVTLKTFRSSVKSGGSSVVFTLRSASSCSGKLTGQTANKYPAGKGKRRTVSLGSARVSLKAGKAKTVVLKLSKASRKLLAAHHRLKVQITVTLTGAATRRTIIRRTITLAQPRASKHAAR
jgi:hypothetical protein